MDKNFFDGSLDPFDTLNWLKNEFKDLVIKKFNDQNRRRKLALYAGDKIPENERNLTDSRNRVSLIIEYEFANIVTEIMGENRIDMFCSYVVANRFPDLEIRDNFGNLGLRFEVKCLQSIAEEKSANFSTLKKDIKPKTDFITIFLWDWDEKNQTFKWDRSPYIFDFFIFNAYELANLRDHYWLNSPPKDLGGGYQGFDLRYAVNCRDGSYNEEEGNYGKLLRLWDKNFDDEFLRITNKIYVEEDYIEFKNTVIFKGFEVLSKKMLPCIHNSKLISVNSLKINELEVGFYLDQYAFIFSPYVNKKTTLELMNKHKLNYVWLFSSKYQWRKFTKEGKELNQKSIGIKPKTLIKDHFSN